jgi:hypothetical protein
MKKLPAFDGDEEARRFMATADPTEHDLSHFKPIREFAREAVASVEAGELQIPPDYNLPEADLAALRGRMLEPGHPERTRMAYMGGVDGWIDDIMAMTRSWGFQLSQIDAPVSVWYGPDDVLSPRGHAEWLIAHLPDAERRELPTGGHLLDGHSPVCGDGLDVRSVVGDRDLDRLPGGFGLLAEHPVGDVGGQQGFDIARQVQHHAGVVGYQSDPVAREQIRIGGQALDARPCSRHHLSTANLNITRDRIVDKLPTSHVGVNDQHNGPWRLNDRAYRPAGRVAHRAG